MSPTLPISPFRFIFIVAAFTAVIKMENGLRTPVVQSSYTVTAPIELIVDRIPDYGVPATGNDCLPLVSDHFPAPGDRLSTCCVAFASQATGALIVIERCAKAACSARTFLSCRTRSFPSSDEDPALVS